ncbi:MAG: HlyD family secretion protein, partial [Tatlockia sp.]|nr:HlyD family secretion protein [Tatlockia sp.]
MENDKTLLNGKKTAVLEKAADSQVVESAKTPTSQIALPELEEKDRVPAKQKNRKSKTLILGLLGVGAIASSIFGYRYWQHASTHQSTDNATVTGHIYQVSTKIPGTVEQVLVSDNQLV